MFFGSIGATFIFVVVTLVFGDGVGAIFKVASTWIKVNLGWFYILGVSLFLIFLIFIAMSRFGRVRLSPNDEPPDHSFWSWFAMLFAAGIGTILMFWGVAEPISHLATPPMQDVEPGSPEAAHEAMAFTLYHFGLHTWTIFALPSLAFAYFIHKRNLPPRVSSLFYPLIQERIHGPVGKAIDIAAIVGTIFGVAVSIGLGSLQINSGLGQLFGIAENKPAQVAIIAVVTLVAFISVARGLDKGVKLLSDANIIAAIALLVFVVMFGPTLTLLKGTVESVGIYASELPRLMFWNDTFANSGWQDGWTVFYWAWTITWSPFVGIFIAKISRGRSIREFVLGVLAAPVSFSVIWFGIFGMAAFQVEWTNGGLVKAVVTDANVPGALFAFLSHYPAATFVSGFSILLVATFFVTSMDSAAMVLDTMGRGYDDDRYETPLHQRAIWVIAVGAIAAVVLTATGEEGLTALQNVITVIGLPFFILAYMMMWAIMRALREDAGELLPLATKRWRPVVAQEEATRRREAGDEAWDSSEVEHDPTYTTAEGKVVAAPELHGYHRTDLSRSEQVDDEVGVELTAMPNRTFVQDEQLGKNGERDVEEE